MAEYKVLETSKGLSNWLKIFKSTMASLSVEKGSKIVYVGCKGTCVPFIELLAFAVRDFHAEQMLVPDGIVDDSRHLWIVDGIGIQVGGASDPTGADVVVLLGGLSMPACTLGVEGSNEVIKKVMKPGGKVVGVCFMSMFEKAGWYGKVPFDTVIDAGIDPIVVQKF